MPAILITVEVDSTYYAIPHKKTVWLWSHRTPENFTFHIKAYGALTGHGIDPKTLPKDLQNLLPSKDTGNGIFILKTILYLRSSHRGSKRFCIPSTETESWEWLSFSTHHSLDTIIQTWTTYSNARI
jgi:hypothetical protein